MESSKPAIVGTKLSKPTPIATKTPTATQSPTIKSTKQAIVAPKAEKHISSTQLVADIRKNLGCGSVDEKYTVQVVAMAIAQTNPKATEKLT